MTSFFLMQLTLEMLCFSTKQALHNAIVHLKIFKIKLQLLVVPARALALTALNDTS